MSAKLVCATCCIYWLILIDFEWFVKLLRFIVAYKLFRLEKYQDFMKDKTYKENESNENSCNIFAVNVFI